MLLNPRAEFWAGIVTKDQGGTSIKEISGIDGHTRYRCQNLLRHTQRSLHRSHKECSQACTLWPEWPNFGQQSASGSEPGPDACQASPWCSALFQQVVSKSFVCPCGLQVRLW